MKRRPAALYLEDVLNYGEKIKRFTEGVTFEQFEGDEILTLAVVRCFEVIGEAANNIPRETQARFSDIPWAQVIAFRNFLIHEYLSISLERVWASVQYDLPETLPRFEQMLATLKDDSNF